ncbi:MAG: WYL domain-containing protein [Lachnospiraceae bacterium]|nr:WYL domain-containing protein [Lachnospiraceae bacterium]
MELFSEIYSCYYQVLRRLLNSSNEFNIYDISSQIGENAFAESLLSIIPKITNGDWELFDVSEEINTDGQLSSKLYNKSIIPLSTLEKSYLKALLIDSRIKLFLKEQQLEELTDILVDVEPLFMPSMFYYYDQFAYGDPYDDKSYQSIFRDVLAACKNKQLLDVEYMSVKNNRVHHIFFPARIEYSIKNDKFRVLAIEKNKGKYNKLITLNMDSIQKVTPVQESISKTIDLNQIIKNAYYKEPVTLIIKNERNALERAMLHFANYEKNTKKIDENTYECLIYYNQSIETELLIEILSFGPMIKVTGNERMLNLIKERLYKQANL